MAHNNFTENQTEILKLLTYILSGVSLLGLLFIIFLFWFFKTIRSYSLGLVVCLSISCIFYNIACYFPTSINSNKDGICIAQALISLYGDLSSVVITTIIGYMAYISVQHQHNIEFFRTRYKIAIGVIGFVLPISIPLM